MNAYTDSQLRQSLAKMLPEIVCESESTPSCLKWKGNNLYPSNVIRDTELLFLCQEIENTLDDEQVLDYLRILLEDVLRCFGGKFVQHFALANASWQAKTEAIAKVKGKL